MTIPNWTWEPNPDYTRLQKAFRRQGDPNFVPFLELFADTEVIAFVLNEPVANGDDEESLCISLDQKICFWHQLGYDALWEEAILEFPDLIKLSAEDTAPLARVNRRWVDEKAGVITNWEQFERYPWPKVSDVNFFPMEYVAHNLPDGMAMIASVNGILETVMWLMGYETLAYNIYDQPDLVQAMFTKMAELFVPLARSVVEMDDVIALWMGDDMGYRTQTMIAPKHLRQYVFPIQKEIASIAHEQELPFLLHSCGQLETVMDDLIYDVGIDAIHSFEDIIEPVESFSARYNHKIAIIGGVDVDLLARGSEDNVRARTREILEACAPGKGYLLGSGNSITNYIPTSNFLAMLDEGWRFNTEYYS